MKSIAMAAFSNRGILLEIKDKGLESSNHSFSTQKAFTLAEVLIVLAVIGIIAALTIPALISNTNKKELETGLKKYYSTLSQALERANFELGGCYYASCINDAYGALYPDWPDVKMFGVHGLLRKYLINVNEVSREETTGVDFWELAGDHQYTTFNKDVLYGGGTDLYLLDDGQMILRDGASIMIENASPWDVMYITVDVNGPSKGPNQFGVDTFTFQIMNPEGLVPMGAPDTVFEDQGTYCSKTSTDEFNGMGCTNRALNDPNYWKEL